MAKQFTGHCLCGNISYKFEGKPSFPHLCSCEMCQRWSGAFTVGWFEIPIASVEWDGPGGEPTYYQSSEKTQRGFCATCGSTINAVDDGYDKMGLTMATLEDSSAIVPGKQHSFSKSAPSWWTVEVER